MSLWSRGEGAGHATEERSVAEIVNAQSLSRPRKRWCAIVLSFLTPGLGHLYSGVPKRAVMFWVISTLGGIVGVAVAMQFAGRAQLYTIVFVAISIPILIAWDAGRVARAASPTFVARAYNRSFVYVGIIVFSALVIQPAARKFLQAQVMGAYHLPSASMAPLLLTGDYILVKPIRSTVERHDIVVYRRGTSAFAKRVVGVGGDTISMSLGKLFVNKKAVSEPYVTNAKEDRSDPEFAWQRDYVLASVARATYEPSLATWGPLLIPRDHYLVLGDDRGNSEDSRYDGFIARADIIALPTIIYYSRDPTTKRVRWTRIGKAIQ